MPGWVGGLMRGPRAALIVAFVVSGCSALTTHSAARTSSSVSIKIAPQGLSVLPGNSCSPVGPGGEVIVLEHLGKGKCRRFARNSSSQLGDEPGSRPFHVPPLEWEFASTGKVLSPLMRSSSLKFTFSVVASTRWSLEALYCVSRAPMLLEMRGPEVGGSRGSNSYQVENFPCSYKNLGHGDYFPTVVNSKYTITLIAHSPAEWASVVMAAENRAPS